MSGASELEFLTGLSDAQAKAGELGTDFTDLVNKLSAIDTSLNSGQWQGEQADRCRQILGLIKDYVGQLAPLAGELQSNISNLISDRDSFSGESKQVQSIKSW